MFRGRGKNTLLAIRLYQQKYPERRKPRRIAVKKLKERFERTGSAKYEAQAQRKIQQIKKTNYDIGTYNRGWSYKY